MRHQLKLSTPGRRVILVFKATQLQVVMKKFSCFKGPLMVLKLCPVQNGLSLN
jgi:hypothetical protein